ncbi:MAG: MFS transporter [Gammaproteobacteria bacterium]|nr:MFS transporter [Gammaproteobacteria bacterium]MDH5801469.1 MFS transporter [Gammaproteobacteria bacterium]
MAEHSQFRLIMQRRFGPFFLTQLLGAFNDNVYKNALMVLLAFQGAAMIEMDSNTLLNLCAGLFILPFFLFSASAGQLADKYEKSKLIRLIKLLEIFIMTGAALAFYFKSVFWLIGLLFLMGLQSTLFGPVKYSILPQHLRDTELVGGNALVESGTFVAILLGTIAGGILVGYGDVGLYLVSAVVIAVAVFGYISSYYIPSSAPADAGLKINWNPITETWSTYKFARQNRSVFLSILGVSWFWFFGAIYLTQIPNYSKLILGGNEQVVTLLLATFSIGIGLGSLLCERLSGHKVELGLVPFGSIGLTLFSVDLYFAAPQAMGLGKELVNATTFLAMDGSWRILFDIAAMGIFGGFYVVPLYAIIQQRCAASHRSRIIAGNNILNAFFLVGSSLLATVFLSHWNFSIPELFLAVAALNAIVAIYIYSLLPEFLMRFIVWVLIHTVYRVDEKGLENIPDEGAAVLVCNHVSLVDALVIAGCIRRPVRFVMYYKIFQISLLSFVFKTAKAIPIAGIKENPQLMEKAFDEISAALRQGELVCIFPEGKLSSDGSINTFRPGVERILERDSVPVYPMALRGLWGSFFSRKDGSAMGTIPKRFWSKIAFVVGNPVAASAATAPALELEVKHLRGDWQ